MFLSLFGEDPALVESALHRQWDILLDQAVSPEQRLLWKCPWMRIVQFHVWFHVGVCK